ncbi:hypothetical protein C8R43DRAFT_1238636 [Mycena crocata]|nr:hypothetical protein C8R43DRAFT_1238636 [Mycena crocata]
MDKLGLELVRSRLTKASSFQDSLQVLLGSSLVNGFGKRMGLWGYNSGRSYAPNHAVIDSDRRTYACIGSDSRFYTTMNTMRCPVGNPVTIPQWC